MKKRTPHRRFASIRALISALSKLGTLLHRSSSVAKNFRTIDRLEMSNSDRERLRHIAIGFMLIAALTLATTAWGALAGSSLFVLAYAPVTTIATLLAIAFARRTRAR
jgi:hypothetical protein